MKKENLTEQAFITLLLDNGREVISCFKLLPLNQPAMVDAPVSYV